VTQNHHSYWFAQLKNYLKLLQEDRKMHNYIKIYVCKHIKIYSNYGGIACIEIKRKINLIQVEIHTRFPALLVENHRRGIEQLKVNVRNLVHFGDSKLHMILIKVLKPYGEPNILAINVTKIILLLIRASQSLNVIRELLTNGGPLLHFVIVLIQCNFQCSHL
jgi:small subunit ribosomal protein S3